LTDKHKHGKEQGVTNSTAIREHLQVLGSDGQHIGTVDTVEGSMIKLTKNDPQAQGQHHYIPLEWVATVDQHVHLNIASQQAMQQWMQGNTQGSNS
jgi:hypothetical protein